MDTTLWLVLFIILLIIEIMTMGLTTVWFAGGAIVALVLAFLKVDLIIQIVAFLIVSIALLILTRPIAIKYFNQEREKTNADSLIGQKGIVLEAIDTIRGTGRVEVNGMEWAAKGAQSDTSVDKGEIVMIEGIQGVKLIVKKEED